MLLTDCFVLQFASSFISEEITIEFFFSCILVNPQEWKFYSTFANRMDTDDHYWCLLTFISHFLRCYLPFHSSVAHIYVRQSESCINPLDLGNYTDLYFPSSGTSLCPNSGIFPKYRNNPKHMKNASETFLSVLKLCFKICFAYTKLPFI